MSASEQRCVGWSHATFGSALAVVHTRAAAAIVCGSGSSSSSSSSSSSGGGGGVCVGLRGHTVWRHVVLHATAPVTALCAEVGQQQQQQQQQQRGHSHIMQGLPPPFAFAAASLCDVHLCDEVTCHMSRVTHHMSHVTCHMSHVTCHMSHVTCHMSRVTCHVSFATLSTPLILLTGTPSSSAHDRHHHNPLPLLLQPHTARRCA